MEKSSGRSLIEAGFAGNLQPARHESSCGSSGLQELKTPGNSARLIFSHHYPSFFRIITMEVSKVIGP